MNRMQMRDWQVEFYFGDIPPRNLETQREKLGATYYNAQYLTATIWVNKEGCKRDDCDPLNVLLHEVAHVWMNYEDDEERQANVIALLLETEINTEKRK